ncbi:MAG: ABC transporter permease [Spirochaetia bacterium]|jgi:peptide/nickel transport system permease protein|uniref:Binding-protein-dependent transport systems inner membrane component n=1 Tax=uncultured spirochete TaxID=156406 RepID=A0A3P3XK41_9SPIR|nr:ABC transporter permease [Rectinema subterraneum]MDQ7797244.1 ABC transporter permease [Spirochaetia bacterium]SLM14428.1 Binding-protein-dependent transport systems inner membrane component [uncultured spirochete]HCX95526.1 peptide ABC transporter permease [Spirochaetaceae bacterium]
MKYLARKFGMLIFTLFVSMSINFFLPRLMPGDPAKALMDRMEGVEAEKLESVRAAFGLDTKDSLPVQYGKYLLNTVKGDLGISLSRFPMPVSSVLASALPWTIGLMGLCTIIGFSIGTLLGIWAAWKRQTKLASFTVGFFTFIRSFPYFWLGLFLIYIFSFKLKVFPLGGAFSVDQTRGSAGWWLSVVQHGILPAFTITLSSIGAWLLMMRNNMINVLAEEFITLAIAKGLPMQRIRLMYAARNAILPSVTGFAMSFGFIVGGGLITEMVFAYPGMGYMLYQAVNAKDYPLMQAIFLIIAASVLVANFLADIAIMLLDPRVRDGAK